MSRFLSLAAVLLWLPMAAWAQHVTVDYAQAPLSEVLAELQRQSGARVYSQLGGAAGQVPVDLQIEDVPLRAALRALCQQLGCHFSQSARRTLFLHEGPDPAAACPSVQAGPYTVRIRSIRITDALNLSFVFGDENPLTFQDRMSIELTMTADEDMDVEAVIGVDHGVTAADDAGRIVAPRQTALPARYYGSQGCWYAEQGFVTDTIALEVPAPEAVSLRTLEGDIVVYDSAEEAAFEFPLEGPFEPQSLGAYTFEVKNVQPEDEDGYYVVETEWRVPRSPRAEPWNKDYLISTDGTRLHPSRGSGSIESKGDELIHRRTTRFRLPADFVPEKFLFEFVAKSLETHTVHFRFEDIPLPPRKE